jgi:uncharacterized 2Fe-2S/4Fe-4S cluster protein (DUF4445 family)
VSLARVRFEPTGVEADVDTGSSVWHAARTADVVVDVPCGGAGLCRGCRVTVEGDVSQPDEHERAALSAEEIRSGVRLACRAVVQGDARVTVRRSPSPQTLTPPPDVSRLELDRTGLAVDVGTTTLRAALVDTATGDIESVVVAPNPQASFGGDVMSRIARAQHGELERMRSAAAEALGRLAVALQVDSFARAAVVGNPTMLHILLGEDPSGMGTAPYRAVFLEERDVDGVDIGLPEGQVTLLPAIGPFVGADTVAGLLAARMRARHGATLYVDVGTNGEIVLGTPDGGLHATSAAAGPAFEGAGIECGMQAVTGAIERVRVESGQLELSVIGETPARGICGSGLADLVAVLLEEGLLAPTGELRDVAGPLGERLFEADGVRALRVQGDVWLTQRDVRQVQLAKGALASAVELLVESAGIDDEDIEEVLIAGGFGTHLDPGSLVALGLIPPKWRERTVYIGEAALNGAARWLSDPQAASEAREIAKEGTVLELAGDPRFQERFLAALAFPS